MSEALVCWQCGEPLDEIPLPISRHANCPQCYTELHCCRLCLDFDPGVADQCVEDRAEAVSNKEGANFCEFFRPRSGAFEKPDASRSDAALSKLDALFGGADSADEEDSAGSEDNARATLDALFGSKPAAD
jgi:hypothetical protein